MNTTTLRNSAISNSLFPSTTLKNAIKQLRFVQMDPIRSPARAQDLILRHRVNGYRNHDLEKQYSSLEIEEDFLYAHGIMNLDVWNLLHPRTTTKLTTFDKKVLEVVQNLQEVHPQDLESYFGKKSVKNWWGGNSRASKMSLDRLHYYGLVKISGRRGGVRLYKPMPPMQSTFTPEKRLEEIIMTIVQVLAPVTHITLKQSLHRIRRQFGPTQPVINNLIKQGRLIIKNLDNLDYIWPDSFSFNNTEIPPTVRFLAPFDPVVWDRVRFEHLWGWPYRFEAYTPKQKRIRGYYAMPLLWGDSVIGWANVNKTGEVDVGFVDKRPQDKRFEQELSAEIDRMREFLQA